MRVLCAAADAVAAPIAGVVGDNALEWRLTVDLTPLT